ncbi:MAG: hypothetical protein ACE5R6_09160 [Candidatus Heimdallarchaeota archaeon]
MVSKTNCAGGFLVDEILLEMGRGTSKRKNLAKRFLSIGSDGESALMN